MQEKENRKKQSAGVKTEAIFTTIWTSNEEGLCTACNCGICFHIAKPYAAIELLLDDISLILVKFDKQENQSIIFARFYETKLHEPLHGQGDISIASYGILVRVKSKPFSEIRDVQKFNSIKYY